MSGLGQAADPIYLRVARAMEASIARGELAPGDRLASERALAEQHGISRMTARQALRHLAEKGLVATRTGIGTFVGRGTIVQRLNGLTGFTEELLRQRRRPRSVVVSLGSVAAEAETAAMLQLAPGTPIHRLVRIRLADAEPVAVETTEIPERRAPGLLEADDFAAASLYATLRTRYGIVPTSAEQIVEAALPEPAVARSLAIAPGQPVLRMTRCTRDAEGRPFEFVRSSYRGDAFALRAELDLQEGT